MSAFESDKSVDELVALIESKGFAVSLEPKEGDQNAASNEKASAPGSKRAELSRATTEHGARIGETGLIGGPFTIEKDSHRFDERLALFDKFMEMRESEKAALPETVIKVTLPSGDVKEGIAFKTSPMDIALGISKGLADATVIAKVKYTNRLEEDVIVACDDDEQEDEDAKEEADGDADDGELWDMTRPLAGDCELTLLKFDDPEAKTVFWHSSAHILGAALELTYGSHLTIGPALKNGFYYDSYMGEVTFHDEDLKKVEQKASETCKKKHPFQRLVISKEEALQMFATNPFKTELIKNKVPEGSKTTVYRVGPLIDLCMGPHIPHTGCVKAFAVTKASATNWLGKVENDPLQRMYGISFPDKGMLKEWKAFQEQAKKRDHRLLGQKQELFFFHQLSPGSAFWLPHGARIYNKLCEFIKKQYWERGYEEVITPNMFNLDLWMQSGHAQHYKENMFVFNVENAEFGMKPMNCPGHCLLFGHKNRSYRDLPFRVADFGVLHRNELSGALSGLTRVRRFCQDDAHIFCRQDQIKSEVIGALDFMRYVYGVFGMTYKLELSTRPKKALGDISLWNEAEAQLAEALNEFQGEGNWRINKGDGAFYGPKIDIKVMDAMARVHQCATIQLDFQLPIRFNLEYRSNKSGQQGEVKEGEAPSEDHIMERPVMVHRAMLGSVERISAILTEHWGGKWPFWLSPRQAQVVPVDLKFAEYAYVVQQKVHEAGFYVDCDDSHRTFNKKIREGQVNQYNFILVVGEKEAEAGTVTLRTRDEARQETLSLDDLIAKFKELDSTYM
jgi:threonyl-tRNA synthetase